MHIDLFSFAIRRALFSLIGIFAAVFFYNHIRDVPKDFLGLTHNFFSIFGVPTHYDRFTKICFVNLLFQFFSATTTV